MIQIIGFFIYFVQATSLLGYLTQAGRLREIFFENKKELEEFRASLHLSWVTHVAGDLSETCIKTFEEYQSEIEKVEKRILEICPELEDENTIVEIDEEMENIKEYSDCQLEMKIKKK